MIIDLPPKRRRSTTPAPRALRLLVLGALGASGLGCLGLMMVDPSELAVCGVESEPPMQIRAQRADDARVEIQILALSSVQIRAVTVQGGQSSSSGLPAGVASLTVFPAAGASALLVLVDVQCVDGVVDQRWFQVGLTDMAGPLEVSPLSGLSG